MVAEGYHSIATTEGLEFGPDKVEIYRYKTEYKFIVELNGITYGPFTRSQLKTIVHASNDALEITG